ncbi:hypothetical protein DBR11_15515 [Pedobacter sp. HMWF019]|nr:hypothetical protein DBR11_15515 [Pedobacter sp. HMWF019]
MEFISLKEIILRLLAAAILGGLVGLERERKEWVAGLRTHTLVCIGAALAMIVSAYGFIDVVGKEGIVLDPSRVAAQVISGVGFLGAGTILFLRQEVVRGLTTAAGLWSVAAVGLAVGGGLYGAAVVATILILFVLSGIKWMEKTWFKQQGIHALTLTAKKSSDVSMIAVEDILVKHHIAVNKISISSDAEQEVYSILFSKFNDRKRILHCMEEIKSLEGVSKIEF